MGFLYLFFYPWFGLPFRSDIFIYLYSYFDFGLNRELTALFARENLRKPKKIKAKPGILGEQRES